jgi:uncharacterized DUF497 family protein
MNTLGITRDRVTWDPENEADHRTRRPDVSFEEIKEGFEFDTALAEIDDRHDELRFRLLGLLGPRVHVVVLNPRNGWWRLITAWKANRKETRRYVQYADEVSRRG